MSRLSNTDAGPLQAGQRVLVWGFGREGRAVLGLLRREYPGLELNLLCHPSEREAAQVFDPSLQILTDPVSHLRLADYALIMKSPGISAYAPELEAAIEQGSVVSSGTALWFARHPQARVVAVTGTKGKSTTSAMLAHLARALAIPTVLAGNIGLPLLEVDAVQAELWVLELSSFQTREAGPVELAVFVSLYEEHLDWHGSKQRYVADKLALAEQARQVLIPADTAVLQQLLGSHRQLSYFGADTGWHVRDGAIWRCDEQVLAADQLPLAGLHNRLNACAALTALEALGYDARAAAPALRRFKPLPHRLQQLGWQAGLAWVNDSISTTPEATLAALHSLSATPVTVIVGGHERGLDWSHFVAEVVATPPAQIITQGANGARIATALVQAGYAGRLSSVENLAEAVALAKHTAAPSSTVLLSPGAPSFDQFADYAARGRAFAQMAGFTADAAAMIEGMGLA